MLATSWPEALTTSELVGTPSAEIDESLVEISATTCVQPAPSGAACSQKPVACVRAPPFQSNTSAKLVK